MVESQETTSTKKSQIARKEGYIKMQIVPALKADTINDKTIEMTNNESKLLMDDSTSHVKLDKVFDEADKKVVKPKDAPKILPWVYIGISNAKSLIPDIVPWRKESISTSILEFCSKFN